MTFTCPRCGMTSGHPADEAEGYCGNCHDWTRDESEPNLTMAEARRVLMERPQWRDRCGNPIDIGRWIDLNRDRSYAQVAETVVGGVWRVSTVWLGIDHQFLDGPPLIFETMVFELAESHGYVEALPKYGLEAHAYRFHADVMEQWRYSTETQAREGHAVMVRLCRERFLPCRLS